MDQGISQVGDNDILALQKIFLNLRKQKWKHKNNGIAEHTAESEGAFVLELQNISTDAACRDWQSAIDAAGGLLEKQGVITAEYIQGMKEADRKIWRLLCILSWSSTGTCKPGEWCKQVWIVIGKTKGASLFWTCFQ